MELLGYTYIFRVPYRLPWVVQQRMSPNWKVEYLVAVHSTILCVSAVSMWFYRPRDTLEHSLTFFSLLWHKQVSITERMSQEEVRWTCHVEQGQEAQASVFLILSCGLLPEGTARFKVGLLTSKNSNKTSLTCSSTWHLLDFPYSWDDNQD